MASQTANQILTRAMRRLQVLQEEEAMTAAHLADGLVTMNGVMHGFGPRGIKYAHVDLASSDTVNVPDQLVDAVVWLVAEALAPDFGVEFTPGQQRQVARALTQMQAAYYVAPPAVPDRALRVSGIVSYDFARGG